MINKITNAQVHDIRVGTHAYLSNAYGIGDKSWHPLFIAVLELFIVWHEVN